MDPNTCFRRFPAWPGTLRWLAIGGLCAWLAACSSAPREPGAQALDLHVQLVASRNVNPDDSGRATPIMVRVYELKSVSAFQSADFFTLRDDERKAVGDDVLAVDEFILRPGNTRTLQRKAHPSTKAVGVLAAYRNLGQSVWRDVQLLRPAPKGPWYREMFKAKEKDTLRISVDRLAVSISVRRGEKRAVKPDSGG